MVVVHQLAYSHVAWWVLVAGPQQQLQLGQPNWKSNCSTSAHLIQLGQLGREQEDVKDLLGQLGQGWEDVKDPQESCAVQGNPFDAEGAPHDVQLLDDAGEM